MQRIAVAEAGRVEPRAVVVDAHGPVDDLVAAVAVHVGDGEAVVPLAAVVRVRPSSLSKVQRRVSLPSRQSQAARTVRV